MVPFDGIMNHSTVWCNGKHKLLRHRQHRYLQMGGRNDRQHNIADDGQVDVIVGVDVAADAQDILPRRQVLEGKASIGGSRCLKR